MMHLIRSAIEFEPMEFFNNLPYLAEGMLGIVIVMGLIIGMILLLNKLFKKD